VKVKQIGFCFLSDVYALPIGTGPLGKESRGMAKMKTPKFANPKMNQHKLQNIVPTWPMAIDWVRAKGEIKRFG
jgi:hypothetical protein